MEWRKDAIIEKSWTMYTGGKALSLLQAKLKIGDRELTRNIAADDAGASFYLFLNKGPSRLQTWFMGSEKLVIGAYYVYLQRI